MQSGHVGLWIEKQHSWEDLQMNAVNRDRHMSNNLKIFTLFNWNISDENILPVTFGKYNPKTKNIDTQYITHIQ